ncbi:hypothetical protein L249_7523, partial [Ophiocordyceps polyrhachis-furcata BCC 54312]
MLLTTTWHPKLLRTVYDYFLPRTRKSYHSSYRYCAILSFQVYCSALSSRSDSSDRCDTLFPASHNGSNYYRNAKHLYSVKDENLMPLLLEEKDAFYDIINALYSNAALTPAERPGLEPNTENYKVDRILNICKIKRSKGTARTEYLTTRIANVFLIITILIPKILNYYPITTICRRILLLVAKRVKLRQLLLPPLPYCYPAEADLYYRPL